jgi:hypothetical protein
MELLDIEVVDDAAYPRCEPAHSNADEVGNRSAHGALELEAEELWVGGGWAA